MIKQVKADNGIICYPGVVYRTKDYYIFKDLVGNREVTESREKNLIKSIAENGYIGAPIIVNENFEVVDGQGRLQACKEVGCQIPFMIIPGLSITECQVLNQNTKNWKLEDYVKSFAAQNNWTFKYIVLLEREFGVNLKVAIYAASGMQPSSAQIKNGGLSVNAGQYYEGRKKLAFIESIKDSLDKTKYVNYRLVQGILFALSCDGVDWDRLRKKIERYYRLFDGALTVEMAVESVENVYNFKTRKDLCVDLVSEYKRKSSENKGNARIAYLERKRGGI